MKKLDLLLMAVKKLPDTGMSNFYEDFISHNTK